jgi:hypothetical protein
MEPKNVQLLFQFDKNNKSMSIKRKVTDGREYYDVRYFMKKVKTELLDKIYDPFEMRPEHRSITVRTVSVPFSKVRITQTDHNYLVGFDMILNKIKGEILNPSNTLQVAITDNNGKIERGVIIYSLCDLDTLKKLIGELRPEDNSNPNHISCITIQRHDDSKPILYYHDSSLNMIIGMITAEHRSYAIKVISDDGYKLLLLYDNKQRLLTINTTVNKKVAYNTYQNNLELISAAMMKIIKLMRGDEEGSATSSVKSEANDFMKKQKIAEEAKALAFGMNYQL